MTIDRATIVPPAPAVQLDPNKWGATCVVLRDLACTHPGRSPGEGEARSPGSTTVCDTEPCGPADFWADPPEIPSLFPQPSAASRRSMAGELLLPEGGA